MSESINSFRDLVAWQKAFVFGCTVYRISKSFPDEERFRMTSQMRRGAISIASNIAEGNGRGSKIDYVRFLKIARGGLYELDTQLMFAVEFQYIAREDYEVAKCALDKTERVLAGLIRALEKRN